MVDSSCSFVDAGESCPEWQVMLDWENVSAVRNRQQGALVKVCVVGYPNHIRLRATSFLKNVRKIMCVCSTSHTC